MKKIFFIFILSLQAKTIYAGIGDSLLYKGKVTLGISLSPIYSIRQVTNYPLDEYSYQYYDENQQGYIYLNYNLFLNYYLKNQWSLETGFSFIKYGNRIDNVAAYDYGGNRGNVKEYDSISLSLKYRCISLPLGIRKDFIMSKIIFGVAIGMRYNIQTSSSKKQINSNKEFYEIKGLVHLKDHFISTFADCQIKYSSTKNLIWFIGSTINITPSNVGVPNQYPQVYPDISLRYYQIGLDFGIIFLL